jgi:hypothetical protein
MTPNAEPFEPLAMYLEPRIGNPYDFQDWTPDLREAVREYLLRELSDEQYQVLLDVLPCEVSSAPRAKQADFILDNHTPLEVGSAAHYMAVKTAPSLELVVDTITAAREAVKPDYTDIGEWLDANATPDQRLAFVHELDPTFARVLHEGKDAVLDITDWIEWRLSEGTLPTAYRMLQAWQAVSAESAKSSEAAVTPSADVIRAWAKAFGHDVGTRGRLSKKMMAAYEKGKNWERYMPPARSRQAGE